MKEKMNNKFYMSKKDVIISIIILLFVFMMIINNSNDIIVSISNNTINNNNINNSDITNEEITEKNEILEIEEKDNKDLVKELSPMEIIRITNHPTFYGKVDDAKSIWSKYLNKEVRINDLNMSYYTDDNIISIYSFGSSNNIIRKIELMLYHIEDKIALEKGFEIAEEYLPFDLLQKYCHYDDSYVLSNQNEKNYIICYKTTEYGYEEREKNKVVLNNYGSYYTVPYNTYVRIIVKNNIVNSIIISDDIPSYLSIYAQKNNYIKEEWHYDFLEK